MHNMPKSTQYHINCKRGDLAEYLLAEYLLIAGDPEIVHKIAKHWSRVKEVSSRALLPRLLPTFMRDRRELPAKAFATLNTKTLFKHCRGLVF